MRTGDCAVCGPGTRIRLRSGSLTSWRCRRPDQRRSTALGRRRRDLRRRYGLEVENLGELIAQAVGCAICGDDDVQLEVDHCHKTMKVRGMLCGPCNRGLGQFRDDPRRLQAALDYLVQQSQPVLD